ncbi:hypothetical protein ACTI_56450 [Actinoplanes sp. OR16]|uniref:P1 family peptidase n=1 Tax=Actinoplanes sp. OR16 TaxID=946334 RepID=UPI000F6B9026|nr:P1 family peptidase [Actinoplanes sp. OR16]BBH68960.1 hypothetical protein ACTI_56450 [Actinoplanes sp. OR16]
MEPQLLSAHAGNWTGDGTGVTVIIPPPGTVGSGEVRGGAPATREFEVLDPTRTVDRVDAVVLSGGSAFGLSAAGGVMEVLRSRGRGFPTPFGPVPIVVGMSIFDPSVGATPPDASAGRDAALAALRGDLFLGGTSGAGAGATSGKWRGGLAPGGLGIAHGRSGDCSLAVVAVVNAWGDVLAADGRPVPSVDRGSVAAPFGRSNTTLAVVLTDATLTKNDCFLLSQSAHDGFARALHPAHSRYDGDAAVALATGEVEADLDLLRAVTTEVTAEAIRAAVTA